MYVVGHHVHWLWLNYWEQFLCVSNDFNCRQVINITSTNQGDTRIQKATKFLMFFCMSCHVIIVGKYFCKQWCGPVRIFSVGPPPHHWPHHCNFLQIMFPRKAAET